MANNSTTGWIPEPAVRGTFRLVVSCIVTLSLCVHTALHLNVPPKGQSTFKLFRKKSKWVLVGIFAPEIFIYVAWYQWISAKRLTRMINKHLKKQPETEGNCGQQWTLTHSHFAQMGGFAFNTNDPGEDPYPKGSPQLSLTGPGVEMLAEMGHLSVPTISFIADKSKANSLAKALVVIQASWLILQCIARAASRLPISTLELNTLAHVVCALLTYYLWWEKPLDVAEPIVLSGEWVRPVAAIMWMFRRVNFDRSEMDGIYRVVKRTHMPSGDYIPRNSAHTSAELEMKMKSSLPRSRPDEDRSSTDDLDSFTEPARTGEYLHNTAGTDNSVRSVPNSPPTY